LVAATWLTTPIIGPAISWLFFTIWSWMGGKSISFMNFFILGLAVDAQKRAYAGAVSNLQQALANAKGDPNALQKAEAAFDDALETLVNADLPPGAQPG
jgi:hypothetical protein